MTPEGAESFERTLELGKEIAASLPDHDVLGRWMAHHVGDLIIRAETASEAEADDVRRETATSVLALWHHRAALPISRPPLDAFEPVFTALGRLSEPQDPWDFYRMFQRGSEPSEDDMAAAPLLRIDPAARPSTRRRTPGTASPRTSRSGPPSPVPAARPSSCCRPPSIARSPCPGSRTRTPSPASPPRTDTGSCTRAGTSTTATADAHTP